MFTRPKPFLSSTLFWLALAAAIRILAACTRVNWHYPDEWYQTIEFSRLILNHRATYVHEMALHLRNLSWPLLLCVPLAITQWIAPHWTHLRVIAAQGLAGALDWAAIFAFYRLSRRWNPFWRALGFALLILPWFRVQDSVSLGAEHISICLIWIALALMDASSWILAGLVAAAVFAVKYPAGLVTLGFTLALFVDAARTREWKSFLRFTLGLAIGAVVLGLPDWIFYGRPWESLWMYLQYNVFTGSATRAFGRQGPQAYLEFFTSRWLHILLPLGIAWIAAGVVATAKGLRRFEPWAWALLLYLAGHLFVGHREPRFMFPAEALLLWGALKWCNEKFPEVTTVRHARAISAVLAVLFVINLPFFFKAALAETGTLNSSYFKIDKYLDENPSTCAVISQRELDSLLIPSRFMPPAIGFFSAQRRIPTFPQSKTKTLAWYESAPACQPSGTVLLLVDHPDVTWIEKGCRLQRSGLLAILPQSLWVPALRRGWVSGPWYVCPASIIGEFTQQVVEDPFFHSISRFPELPPFGINSDELDRFREQYSRAPQCRWTCS